MIRTIGFPGRYIQGPGAIQTLPSLLAELGCTAPVIVSDDIVIAAVGSIAREALQQAGMKASIIRFPGECSVSIIASLSAQATQLGVDVVVALGGGKTIDTAKGVAKSLGVALVVVPTIASNDSPTSRLIVLYDDSHRVAGVEVMARNPDAVLVDTNIVARAPARFFAAGLGDALSKKFESEQCHLSGGRNFFGTPSLPIARLLAGQCYETIIEYGRDALARVTTTQTPDESVERVVEATVLLSGIGFESGGLSLAHALTRGFTAHPNIARMLHGELVAFGSIVQLVAQELPVSEIENHVRFVADLGLPICWNDLGAPLISVSEIDEVSRLTCAAPYIGNLHPKADTSRVVWALRRADAIGQAIKKDAPHRVLNPS
jgi:glycerol dehydrogenase